MKKNLTEIDFLKKNHLSDIGDMPKEGIKNLAKMMPMISPDALERIISRFPEYADAVKGWVDDVKEVAVKAIDVVDGGRKDTIEKYNSVLEEYQNELANNSTLSNEQRMELLRGTLEIANSIKETNNKAAENVVKIVSVIGAVVVGLATIAVQVAAIGNGSTEDADFTE